jgi:hypothetical protein
LILLFDNLVDSATLTSLNASLNYPVTNLQDPVLRKRYQSSTDSDTITITFDAVSSVQDFWYAWTNADSMELRLYDSGNVLLNTIVVSNPQDIDAHHLTSAVSAAYAELDVYGYGGVYVGGIGIGLGVDFPDPNNKWTEDYQDNSSVSQSTAGQSLQDYVEPLQVDAWVFRDIPRDEMNVYKELYKELGIGKPIWIDPFENDHSFREPIYASITQPFRAKKNGRVYNFNLNIKEAR